MLVPPPGWMQSIACRQAVTVTDTARGVQNLRPVVESNYRDNVLGPQLGHHGLQRSLYARHLVAVGHRAAFVDNEHQVERPEIGALVDLGGGKADLQHCLALDARDLGISPAGIHRYGLARFRHGQTVLVIVDKFVDHDVVRHPEYGRRGRRVIDRVRRLRVVGGGSGLGVIGGGRRRVLVRIADCAAPRDRGVRGSLLRRGIYCKT